MAMDDIYIYNNNYIKFEISEKFNQITINQAIQILNNHHKFNKIEFDWQFSYDYRQRKSKKEVCRLFRTIIYKILSKVRSIEKIIDYRAVVNESFLEYLVDELQIVHHDVNDVHFVNTLFF